MSQDFERERVDAGEAGEGTVRELGQLLVVGGGKVLANVGDLVLDQVKVIEEPLEAGEENLLLVSRTCGGAIGLLESLGIGAHLPQEIAGAPPLRRQPMSLRQQAAMRHELLMTEEAGTAWPIGEEVERLLLRFLRARRPLGSEQRRRNEW